MAFGLSLSASAQLSENQRLIDFQNLSALYTKRYAPYEWKKQALGFDVIDTRSWLDRVRAARTDLEFFEIEAEYVASLQDTHAGFQMTSSFRALLGGAPGNVAGLRVDIYDGKVLVDYISRSLLPTSLYPFEVGDEIVSVDGVSAEEWIQRASRWRQYGNPNTTRRYASQQIVARIQYNFPRAIEIGDQAAVEVRRANGALERYQIPWAKSGIPVTTVGPVPFPGATPLKRAASQPDYLQALDDLHNYRLPDSDTNYYVSLGAKVPHFSGGFPAGFSQRLGRYTSEFHYSGTYTANEKTIGYVRIPSFSPTSSAAAAAELRAEIDYLQKNTDGLVIDVTRNPGGGCYMIDAAAALIPYPFYFFGEQVRATQVLLNSYQTNLENAILAKANPWVIDAWQLYVDRMKAALAENRGMTSSIPACAQTGSGEAPVSFNNKPSAIVYRKPLIVLIDELSISAADIFPAMLQDNRRGLLVGTRSSGGGGAVSGYTTGHYSESYSTNTISLVVRKNPIVTPEYPTAPYVENIGARPDVPLEFMTRENLMAGGRPYVEQFTRILTDEIRASSIQKNFTLADAGSASWTAAPAAGPPLPGYSRIRAAGASTTPAGLAVLGYRLKDRLVTEAAIPAVPAIQGGRVLAEIGGSVSTGIAMANPNYFPVTVSFYFTAAEGKTRSGSFNLPAKGQIAAFLDQAPFQGPKAITGTFTFHSSARIAAIALRSYTNEPGELLMAALPVADLSDAPVETSPLSFPHFADGGGWATEIALVNPTDSVITGTMLFRNPFGFDRPVTVDGVNASSFSYSIPPRMVRKFATSGVPPEVQTGSILVIPSASNPSPVGSAVFSMRQGGRVVNQTGIMAVRFTRAYRLYAEAAGDFDKAAIGSMQTGLAVANGSSSPATVRLELYRPDGSSLGKSGTMVLPGDGQISKFLNQIAGLENLPLPFQGVVRISSPAPIAAIGLRGRYNESKDFLVTTMPLIEEAGKPADTELFFPHFVQAGGYTTQFVVFSGLAGQQSAGALRFVSQSGESLDLALR